MVDYTPSRSGQLNAVGGSYANNNALFNKKFGDMVLLNYTQANMYADKVMTRISKGAKSLQFPATYKVGAAYHTPGVELLGDQILKGNERIILLDEILQSNIFSADIDELKSSFDLAPIYAEEMGNAMAIAEDTQRCRLMILAARASATISGGFGGSSLTNAAYATDGNALADGIFDGGAILDQKNVIGQKYIGMLPTYYTRVVRGFNAIDRDWGGEGSYAGGNVNRINDTILFKTNSFPSGTVAALPGENNAYNGDFTNTIACMFTKATIGTIQAAGMKAETQRISYRLGDFMVVSKASGHGILRPETAVEFKVA